jgi:hypothetical protein
MPLVRKPFVLALTGSSLTTGRLNAGWAEKLARDLELYPEAQGPIVVYNWGHGGWSSADILANAPNISKLKPKHILCEPGGINSSAVSGGVPAVSRAQHVTNLQAMVAEWQANIPGVDITIQTMSPVSAAGAALRPDLADYYADEIVQAISLGLGYLDNYAAWPKPLDPTLTNGAAPFVVPATAGYEAMPDGSAWNAADKAASLALTGDALQAIGTLAGTNASVRGNTPLAGTQKFEVKVVAFSGLNLAFGVADAAMALNALPGSEINNHSVALRPNGAIVKSGATLTNAGFAFGSGDTIGVEVDVPNKNIYFVKGATRSPAASFAALTGPNYYPVLGLNGVSASATARFTPSGDGLHPVWAGAVDTYLYPAVLAWARAKMAAYWSL